MLSLSMEDNQPLLPFNNKNLLPKDRLDRGLFLFLTVIIPLIALWETSILLHYHPTLDYIVILHLIGEIFVLVNIIGNLYYIKRIDASSKHKHLPIVLKPGWRFCHFCELNSPPRSYHCPICDECILKRDKHCMFAGCCIGFHNHRYYFLALVYLWIGACYCFSYQSEYFLQFIGGFNYPIIFKITAPHIALVTGFVSFYAFLVTLTQITLFLSVLLTSYMLFQQIACISNGQTLHERLQKISLYHLGFSKNFKLVLGRQWYLAILLPFLPSHLEGDGLRFATEDDIFLEEFRGVKDV